VLSGKGECMSPLQATPKGLVSRHTRIPDRCYLRSCAMRKIVAGLFMSPDGVVEAPEAWGFQYFDEEMTHWLGDSAARWPGATAIAPFTVA
jgi:hypothetical protein